MSCAPLYLHSGWGISLPPQAVAAGERCRFAGRNDSCHLCSLVPELLSPLEQCLWTGLVERELSPNPTKV